MKITKQGLKQFIIAHKRIFLFTAIFGSAIITGIVLGVILSNEQNPRANYVANKKDVDAQQNEINSLTSPGIVLTNVARIDEANYDDFNDEKANFFKLEGFKPDYLLFKYTYYHAALNTNGILKITIQVASLKDPDIIGEAKEISVSVTGIS